MHLQQTSLDFTVHTSERKSEGTSHVQKNAVKFAGDCKKLIKFWQSGKWYWLSNEDGRSFGISSYLSARVYDLRHKNGIQIDDKMDGNIKRFRLKCTCKLVGGNDVIDNCMVHDPQMKVI